jgi:hypothetical protein
MTTSKDLTPTCQGDDFATADLVAVLESCWSAIRSWHSDIPKAVMVVGSGSPTRPTQPMKWGHFAALRWQHGKNVLPEVLVSGEGLSRTPAEVLTTLLHEAAHALAHARDIKDTSRQGRWHNKHFAVLAKELGLTPSKDPKIGWSPCTLPESTAVIYGKQLADLTDALRVFRIPEPLHIKGRTNSNNGLSAECDCDPIRKIRVSKAVYEAGPILCGVCKQPFTSDEPLDDDTDDGDSQ